MSLTGFTEKLFRSRRTRVTFTLLMIASLVFILSILFVSTENKNWPMNAAFECNATDLRAAQRQYFENHLRPGYGYARFFSNKAWTDQVAIALYFMGMQDFGCHTCPNPQHLTFIDVGANIGQTVRFISELLKEQESKFPKGSTFKIVSVEPSPQTYTELVKEVKRARLMGGHEYISLNNGVGEKRGLLQFYSHGNGDQGATFNVAARQGRPRHSMVKVITVDDIVNYHGGHGKVILKIDVEGFETNVMRGAANALQHKRIDALVWEWVPEKMSKGSLKEQADFLSKYGYEVFISTLHVMVRIDSEYWDDGYETTRKTINCAAYRRDSTELLAIKSRNYLCGGLGSTSEEFFFNACECWSGKKSELPPDSFQELKQNGFPMGRE